LNWIDGADRGRHPSQRKAHEHCRHETTTLFPGCTLARESNESQQTERDARLVLVLVLRLMDEVGEEYE
jgi:hypothetical protein